ncbi:MAG: heme NO-binding domain-containing protein [Bacteroidia bacterium]
MYGIVNKVIRELVVANYGEAKWEAIRKKSGVTIDLFLSNEAYDDTITYKLAIAASEELNVSTDQVLHSFGEWWVLKTAQQHYGSMMSAGGKNLREFLINLPNFHNRVSLLFPKLSPPEFRISNLKEHSLHLHYYSGRPGLNQFVHGLVSGLAKMFNEEIVIQHIDSRDKGLDHEVFLIQWII